MEDIQEAPILTEEDSEVSEYIKAVLRGDEEWNDG
jgi:hypothetical protein